MYYSYKAMVCWNFKKWFSSIKRDFNYKVWSYF